MVQLGPKHRGVARAARLVHARPWPIDNVKRRAALAVADAHDALAVDRQPRGVGAQAEVEDQLVWRPERGAATEPEVGREHAAL